MWNCVPLLDVYSPFPILVWRVLGCSSCIFALVSCLLLTAYFPVLLVRSSWFLLLLLEIVLPFRRVALCGCLCDKPVSQLKDMEYEIFEQLEADLDDDREYSVMRAALRNFFRWINLMDTLDQEMQLRRSSY
ncbi:hypothetical protein LIER_11637 [Lithospermum erythrorhizon]|uniref:Uncharacterized protein n=1 Tax=Lithospermum erythrorhizon TaxID=34254 RepID=A0AAV3PTV9_LITER